MAFRKVKDLSVKVGTYTQNGETKGRWETVGAVMRGDDGSEFLTLKRTFNPAGVNVDPGKDQIIISMFDPKPADGQRSAPAPQQQRQLRNDDFDESDVPF
jgi:hypothetical protein